jgi:5-methylcytosine-specific restriction protein B
MNVKEKVEVVSKRRYWLYSPGERAKFWKPFYKNGIMGIGWGDDLGDLSRYNSKEDIKADMKRKSGNGKSHKNGSLALWQFAKEVAIGDIVFAKCGMGVIIGRGVVKSKYIYCAKRREYKHIHEVTWTQKGDWEHPGKIRKTLTNITQKTEYVEKLETLVLGE